MAITIGLEWLSVPAWPDPGFVSSWQTPMVTTDGRFLLFFVMDGAGHSAAYVLGPSTLEWVGPFRLPSGVNANSISAGVVESGNRFLILTDGVLHIAIDMQRTLETKTLPAIMSNLSPTAGAKAYSYTPSGTPAPISIPSIPYTFFLTYIYSTGGYTIIGFDCSAMVPVMAFAMPTLPSLNRAITPPPFIGIGGAQYVDLRDFDWMNKWVWNLTDIPQDGFWGGSNFATQITRSSAPLKGWFAPGTGNHALPIGTLTLLQSDLSSILDGGFFGSFGIDSVMYVPPFRQGNPYPPLTYAFNRILHNDALELPLVVPCPTGTFPQDVGMWPYNGGNYPPYPAGGRAFTGLTGNGTPGNTLYVLGFTIQDFGLYNLRNYTRLKHPFQGTLT